MKYKQNKVNVRNICNYYVNIVLVLELLFNFDLRESERERAEY